MQKVSLMLNTRELLCRKYEDRFVENVNYTTQKVNGHQVFKKLSRHFARFDLTD